MKELLHYKQYGESGSPIIILHGLFGMLDNWVSIAKQLSDTYRIYLIDQRNHGRSFHSSEFDYSLLADDLTCWMDHVGLDTAHIVGHSMGGKVAMQFAQNYPNRCQSLMVLDIAPRGYEDGHSLLFDAILSLDLSQVGKRSDADQLLSSKVPDWGVRQFLLKNLSRADHNQWEWRANFPILKDNYHHISGAIDYKQTLSLPTLLVRGARSGYVLDSDLDDLRHYFSEAKMVDVDAGHWIHAEKKVEMIEIIRDYII